MKWRKEVSECEIESVGEERKKEGMEGRQRVRWEIREEKVMHLG